MAQISVADAKARFSELLTRAESGEDIEITRRGKPIVRLVSSQPKKKPIDIEALRKLTEGMPMQKIGAGEFVRQMRDEYRY